MTSPLAGTAAQTPRSSRSATPPVQTAPTDHRPDLDRFEHGLIARKVKQMIGRAGLTREDLDDLRQELTAKAIQSLQSFDPQRGHRRAYLVAVVERDVAKVLRDRSAAKRKCPGIRSLDADLGRFALIHCLDESIRTAHCGHRPRTDVELWALSEDVSAALALLPDDLRDLAEQLKTKSIDQIAEEWSVPRTTLNDRVRKLRQRFEHEEFYKYL